MLLDKKLLAIFALLVVAAGLRLIPHPANFAPIGAMALFAGAHLGDKRLAFILPLSAMLVSDMFIGFHPLMFAVYGGFACVIMLGFWLNKRLTITRLALATVGGSTIFFVISNFGVWLTEPAYPLTLQGITTCYLAAIPFFQNTVLGDAVFVSLLFGAYALMQRGIIELQKPTATY